MCCWGFFELASFHIMWGDPYGKGSINICTWWWFVHRMMFDDNHFVINFLKCDIDFWLSDVHILQLMLCFSKYDIKRFSSMPHSSPFIHHSSLYTKLILLLLIINILSKCSLFIAHHSWTSISLCNMKRNHKIDRHDLFVIGKCNLNKHRYLSYANTHTYISMYNWPWHEFCQSVDILPKCE